jgi:hypothetical protein
MSPRWITLDLRQIRFAERNLLAGNERSHYTLVVIGDALV